MTTAAVVVLQARRAGAAPQVRRARRAPGVQPARLVLRALRVPQALRVAQVLRVPQARQVLLVPRARPVLQAQAVAAKRPTQAPTQPTHRNGKRVLLEGDRGPARGWPPPPASVPSRNQMLSIGALLPRSGIVFQE